MEWADKYAVGVREIDEQHQEIFKKIDWLMRSDDDIEEAILFITSYVTEHFRSEEKIMEMIQYKGARKHRATHREFEKEMAGYIEMIPKIEGRSDLVSFRTELGGKVAGWLLEHIASEDYKLSLAVKEFSDLALRDVPEEYLR